MTPPATMRTVPHMTDPAALRRHLVEQARRHPRRLVLAERLVTPADGLAATA
jgi:hypothetical protein